MFERIKLMSSGLNRIARLNYGLCGGGDKLVYFPNHRAQNGHINQQHEDHSYCLHQHLQSFTLILIIIWRQHKKNQREIIWRKESVGHK